MRQTHLIANPFSKVNPDAQPIEVTRDFPLFRKLDASDSWRKDITYTRIDEDRSSVSVRYLRSTQYDQETFEVSKGHIAFDTGILDYTLGTGEYALSEQEFVSVLAHATRLLAQVTQQIGPLSEDAINPLLDAVAHLKQRNGSSRSGRERERGLGGMQ
jgi:hypothetical protein